MHQPVTITLDETLLALASDRAAAENRTLSAFIEALLEDALRSERRDRFEVAAPPDVRSFEPVPIEGETPERYDYRRRLIGAILDEGGY